MSIVYLNGAWCELEKAHISPLDRGFLFADSVYEVIPVYHQQLFTHKAHLERLNHSLEGIALHNPLSTSEWTSLFNTLISKNEILEAQSIYLQISRGAPVVRDHTYADQSLEPTVFVMINPYPDRSIKRLSQGFKVITLEDERWPHCEIKSTSLLPNIIAKQKALQNGAEEAILIDDHYVTEGSTSNVFMVKDNKVITTPISNHILQGITRSIVIELIQQQSLEFEERLISLDELKEADEIWITSSTKEIMPIIQLNDQTVHHGQAGPLWKRLIQAYKDRIEHECRKKISA